MSNKKKGSDFEKEFAQILYNNGFWVRLDKGYAQTNDIIAGRNGSIYLFECKTCKKDYFDMNREEENQHYSRKLFKKTGNNNAWVVYKLDDGRIFLHEDFIKKPSEGIEVKDWFLKMLGVKVDESL